MGIFPEIDEDAIYVSRTDVLEALGTCSKHAFELDGFSWPSVEHYFQAMKFENDKDQEKIRLAPHPDKARKLGRSRFRKLRKDWKKIREVVMTRAVYIKCRTHQEVADKLLATEDRKIIESAQYDYFWGCGRDRRGNNTYGKVLMNVRSKLREELAQQKEI